MGVALSLGGAARLGCQREGLTWATLIGDRFCDVRTRTEALAAPLSGEDQTVQSMPDVSPTKWHRAHTTWFFETFVLADTAYAAPYDPAFDYLFNSYYELDRPEVRAGAAAGVLSRPGAAEIGALPPATSTRGSATSSPAGWTSATTSSSSSACTTSSSTKSSC